MAKTSELSQFNVRMEAELLEKYRKYCKENGLDPHIQIVNYIRRLVETKYDFQEKLWEIMREGKKTD
ncbi:MAG: hypothetical protein AB1779_00320 [Candidatus Thermoplasmatota archaeon]